MNRFIHPHQENTRQQGFWKIANDGSNNEADSEYQAESQTAEALDNLDYVTSQNSSLTLNDSASQIQSLLNPFLESSKSKRQQKEIVNGTTPVSSLKASVELWARTWPRPRMNMWIPEELPGTARNYTRAMSMIAMRLARTARLTCYPWTTSYPWMLLFSLFVWQACSL